MEGLLSTGPTPSSLLRINGYKEQKYVLFSFQFVVVLKFHRNAWFLLCKIDTHTLRGSNPLNINDLSVAALV